MSGIGSALFRYVDPVDLRPFKNAGEHTEFAPPPVHGTRPCRRMAIVSASASMIQRRRMGSARSAAIAAPVKHRSSKPRGLLVAPSAFEPRGPTHSSGRASCLANEHGQLQTHFRGNERLSRRASLQQTEPHCTQPLAVRRGPTPACSRRKHRSAHPCEGAPQTRRARGCARVRRFAGCRFGDSS
jgi:hypothetical protein